MENNYNIVASSRVNLDFDVDDNALLIAIDKAISDGKKLKDEIDKVAQKNFLYWKDGTARDLSQIHPKQSRVVVNRIFTDVETSLPIITSETPEPSLLGEIANDTKIKLQKGLEIAYDVKYKMQYVFQQMIRNWYISRIGVMKYRWDKNNGFMTENVVPNKIGFDPRATDIYKDCEYIWEEMEDTIENLVEKFPKKKKEIEQLASEDKTKKTKLRYTEFWGGGGEWVCWRLNNFILDKKKNPNFDWDDSSFNLFEAARFPYLILNVFTIGDKTGLYDNVSLIEEAAPVQEAVNQLEQQIFDLNEGRKRVWVASGEAMSEKKAQALVNETGDLMVYLDRKGGKDAVAQVQSGTPDAGMYNNLTHLLGEIDNIMGMHSTTRGERAQQETATGRQLLVGSDYGRLDLIVRNLEQCAEDWYNAYLHMIKVYGTEAEILSDGEVQIELTGYDIPPKIQVMVVKGSTLPIDEKTKRDNAISLARMGMIDPETLFEEMGYPNPGQRAQKLYQWMTATGRMAPQGGLQAGGVPDEVKMEQTQRIQQALSSEEFKRLDPEQQKQYLSQARQALEAIKNE